MSRKAPMEKDRRAFRSHVLVLPYPVQGHINPMLQFSKRLVSKGLKATLVTTIWVSKSMHVKSGSVGIDTISDGYDGGGFSQAESIDAYLTSLKTIGSRTLAELIKQQENSGQPVNCLVYDLVLPWALDVAKQFGLIAASFFTHSCAVCSIYYHVHRGLITLPVSGPTVSIAGLPLLEPQDLPSHIYTPELYPAYLALVLDQLSNVGKADWVLINTFDRLENEVVNWMAKFWPLRAIGPSIPSMYLEKRLEDDNDYGLSLFKPEIDLCMNWLNSRTTGSVVYVSFGSLASLGVNQMEEIALGLKKSGSHFLWIVRESERDKLPSKVVEETSEKGLLLTWCPQLEVLAHEAVGCFVTHCGWNSTLEALSLGVPMIGVPQWTDQATDAKYIEDVWEVGLRASRDEKGIIKREELQKCIKEVMEGERGKRIKENALKWKNLAMQAMDKGGSSDKNIDEFVATLESI